MTVGDVVVSTENLGKQYRKVVQARGRIRDVVAERASRSARPHGPVEPFWALRHVDLEVMAGQVTGIIGRNGAGKSTLLKLLSRITTPSEGRAEIDGRVGSLLEVGTGFHIDLTGRENVFFSGAVLGMGRAEVRRKLDDIIEFAGVERFIDTPVKHFSSGMQVRLGFAVAAHLEPEVLIVDEVLAVGDAAFQKRCLDKISEIAANGRAILLVSHDLAAVRARCDVAHLFDAGLLVASGPPQEIVDTYLSGAIDEGPRLLSVRDWKVNGSDDPVLPRAGPCAFEVSFDVATDLGPSSLTLTAGRDSVAVCQGALDVDLAVGGYVATFEFDRLPLGSGRYELTLTLESSGGRSAIALEPALVVGPHASSGPIVVVDFRGRVDPA